MNASLQAAGGRHLWPANPPFIFRAIIMERNEAGQWTMACVFEMSDFDTAYMTALELCTEPYEPGITAMHFVVGEVANG